MADKLQSKSTLIEQVISIDRMVNALKQQIYTEQESLASVDKVRLIEAPQLLGKILDERRKELGISMKLLELQTGVSSATLTRLFKNPEQIKFLTVFNVASALGVNLCIGE